MMQELIKNFLIEIGDAIAAYGEKAQPLSKQRQVEIHHLKSLLAIPRTDLSEYISVVKGFLPKIKTGTRFFETGNSEFKDSLTRTLNFYNDPVVVLLMRMEKEYRNKKNYFINYLQKLSDFISVMKKSKMLQKVFNENYEIKKTKINYPVMLRFRR